MEFAGMVDLARSPAEIKKERDDMKAGPSASPSVPVYPYGMCLSMDTEVLEKLGLDGDLPETGDMLHIVAIARVTFSGANEVVQPDGTRKRCPRVELQITHLEAEDEDEEGDRESHLAAVEARDKERGAAFYAEEDEE